MVSPEFPELSMVSPEFPRIKYGVPGIPPEFPTKKVGFRRFFLAFLIDMTQNYIGLWIEACHVFLQSFRPVNGSSFGLGIAKRAKEDRICTNLL